MQELFLARIKNDRTTTHVHIECSEEEGIVDSNTKTLIINSILKTTSGFGTEWKFEQESGFEQEDFYHELCNRT